MPLKCYFALPYFCQTFIQLTQEVKLEEERIEQALFTGASRKSPMKQESPAKLFESIDVGHIPIRRAKRVTRKGRQVPPMPVDPESRLLQPTVSFSNKKTDSRCGSRTSSVASRQSAMTIKHSTVKKRNRSRTASRDSNGVHSSQDKSAYGLVSTAKKLSRDVNMFSSQVKMGQDSITKNNISPSFARRSTTDIRP